MRRFISMFTAVVVFCACKGNSGETEENGPISSIPTPANLSYNIVATYPHDTESYTQGLIWQNNTLYEGTGLEGHSKLMKVDLKNGKAVEAVNLDPTIFGEGITILNNKIYQLSWQNHKVFVYDANTFKKLKELEWLHEGWGLTHNGKDLIVSTGESNIYFVDPETFQVRRTISVKDNNGPVGNLNELEFINGSIYANIYLTDYIIKIDPNTGYITGKMDMTGLLEKAGKQVDREDGLVLNGIAYDSAKNSLYITGKKWPLMFEMKVQ